MDIIVSVCVLESDHVLMVQEGKEKALGLWNLPSGHLEMHESVFDGAIREVREETGYGIAITGLISIHNVIRSKKPIFRVNFMGRVISEAADYNTTEIMQVKWIPLNVLSQFEDKNCYRSFESLRDIIGDVVDGVQFPAELVKNVIC